MSITGGSRTRAISKRYPVTTGLIKETTKTSGRKIQLDVPESTVRKIEKTGF